MTTTTLDAAAIGSERSRPALLAPLAGLGLIGGLIALFVSPGGGESGETPREVVAYAASHERWILAMAFFGLAVIPLGGIFVAALHARLRGIATATESTLVLIGGIAFTLSFSLALTDLVRAADRHRGRQGARGGRRLPRDRRHRLVPVRGLRRRRCDDGDPRLARGAARRAPSRRGSAGSASRWASRRSPRSRSSASSPGWHGSQARRS